MSPADGAVYTTVYILLAEMHDAETSLSGASATPRRAATGGCAEPRWPRMILIRGTAAVARALPGDQIDMGVSDRLSI